MSKKCFHAFSYMYAAYACVYACCVCLVHMQVSVQLHTCMCSCGGQRLTLGVSVTLNDEYCDRVFCWIWNLLLQQVWLVICVDKDVDVFTSHTGLQEDHQAHPGFIWVLISEFRSAKLSVKCFPLRVISLLAFCTSLLAIGDFVL